MKYIEKLREEVFVIDRRRDLNTIDYNQRFESKRIRLFDANVVISLFKVIETFCDVINNLISNDKCD